MRTPTHCGGTFQGMTSLDELPGGADHECYDFCGNLGFEESQARHCRAVRTSAIRRGYQTIVLASILIPDRPVRGIDHADSALAENPMHWPGWHRGNYSVERLRNAFSAAIGAARSNYGPSALLECALLPGVLSPYR